MAIHFTSPHDLFARLHRADAPTILDMRDADDAAADPRRIPGARAISLAELDGGAAPSGPIVCSCQKGGKLSQLGAGLVRARGGVATALTGGHLAWIEADLPTVATRPLAERWVMPLDPSWAELTAFWVLHRLIDRAAPVIPVERDWIAGAEAAWEARALPNASDLASEAGFDHPILSTLDGGPDRLVAGRLARVPTPDAALDLIDDWIAQVGAAA